VLPPIDDTTQAATWTQMAPHPSAAAAAERQPGEALRRRLKLNRTSWTRGSRTVASVLAARCVQAFRDLSQIATAFDCSATRALPAAPTWIARLRTRLWLYSYLYASGLRRNPPSVFPFPVSGSCRFKISRDQPVHALTAFFPSLLFPRPSFPRLQPLPSTRWSVLLLDPLLTAAALCARLREQGYKHGCKTPACAAAGLCACSSGDGPAAPISAVSSPPASSPSEVADAKPAAAGEGAAGAAEGGGAETGAGGAPTTAQATA